MAEESDETLMRAVAGGNVDALGALFARHHARVHALCFRLTQRADAADDVTQEIFLRVLRYRDAFRGESSFSTWLYRLALNACHDNWRRGQRDDALNAAAQRDAERATPSSETDDRHVLLEQAMARLEPEQRAVLVLSRYNDLGYDDVARVLQCTPAAARVRAHRALNVLREIYRELERRQHGLR